MPRGWGGSGVIIIIIIIPPVIIIVIIIIVITHIHAIYHTPGYQFGVSSGSL